jgi:hypothetical protein
MNTIIPAGYRITCTSWENDGDNYNTKTVEGLTREHVHLYTDLLKLLSRRHKDGDHGNLYEPGEDECQALADDVKAVLAKHEGNDAIPDDIDLSDVDSVVEYFCDVVGDFTGSSEHYLTRVVESVQVHLIPHPIEMALVTEEFWN